MRATAAGKRRYWAVGTIVATLMTPGQAAGQTPCCLAEGLAIAGQYQVAGLENRRFNHEIYWAAMGPALASDRVRVSLLGESIEGRAINAVSYGAGPTSVLLWSQMHGNESTASMALADLINYFATADSSALASLLADQLTVTMIPMLNPDGAERFIRENAIGIDVNRDARILATPEGQLLKRVRDSLQADFGFNLHDQGSRTAGDDGLLVAIALLAPAADEERSWGPVRLRARKVAAAIAGALEPEIPGRMARYDDTYATRAFGDRMQQWGTSTVLIESGALPDDPQKQRLRAINVAAFLTALYVIAQDSLDQVPDLAYERLPLNRSVANHLLLLGGKIVLGSGKPIRTDITIVFDDAVAETGPRYGEVGDLGEVIAMDTVDVTGLYIHPDLADGFLRRGAPVVLRVRREADPESEEVWRIGEAITDR
ncbi:MAG: M14 metallopeptidase family protein [Gemmatimonadales bacterium]